MTLPKYGLDYRKCSVAELRQFIKAKAGQDAERGLPKASYIAILHNTNKCMTFRFMDLAPELRNSIYECLLIHDKTSKPKRKAYPAILQASRKVHKEARGILLAESTLYLRGIFSQIQNHSFTVVKSDIGSLTLRNGFLPDMKLFHAWTQNLRNAENIFFEVFFETFILRRSNGTMVLDAMRYYIVDFLINIKRACRNAKRITVKLVYKSRARRFGVVELMRHLRALPAGCTLKFEGLTEQEEVEVAKGLTRTEDGGWRMRTPEDTGAQLGEYDDVRPWP